MDHESIGRPVTLVQCQIIIIEYYKKMFRELAGRVEELEGRKMGGTVEKKR